MHRKAIKDIKVTIQLPIMCYRRSGSDIFTLIGTSHYLLPALARRFSRSFLVSPRRTSPALLRHSLVERESEFSYETLEGYGPSSGQESAYGPSCVQEAVGCHECFSVHCSVSLPWKELLSL